MDGNLVGAVASPILNVPTSNVSQIKALVMRILKLVSDVKSNKRWWNYEANKSGSAK